MHNIVKLGKVAYTGTRKINAVEIEVTIKDGRLSMVGGIWNSSRTDYVTCGQNYDEIRKMFPRNAKVRRMVEIWERWHLNDMRAGTPRQEEYLRTLTPRPRGYEATCQALTDAGLLVDDGYRYGSRWLTEALPAEVIAEVETW